MLIEFRVKNFRSVKDEAVLSMVSSTDTTTLPQNIIDPIKGFKHRLLKSAALYGANASGKSNVIKAMLFMSEFVRTSDKHDKDTPVPITPFMFDEASSEGKSFFEASFLFENVRYVYGFELDKTTIHAEWLYYYPKGKRSLIFERENAENGKIIFHQNKSVVKKEKWDFIEYYISNNSKTLIATFSEKLNCSPVDNAYKFFSKLGAVNINNNASFAEHLTSKFLLDNPAAQKMLLSVLKTADFDIVDIEIREEEVEPVLSKLYKIAWEEELYRDENSKQRLTGLLSSKQNKTSFLHTCKMISGISKNCKLDLVEESEGTQKMFIALIPFLSVINRGQTMILDEFDLKLHPMLAEFLIKYFHEHSKTAQIIFTTHNTELLFPEIFRRDQIWFTQKKRDSNSTEIYSLHDFKDVRKDQNFRKSYLDGRYGAIPILGRFNK